MAKIIALSEDVIAKIAAGEVIERPSYAVKELIENAIDAEADVIEIHIEDGGLGRIQVRDNGSGMTEEDLRLSFLPHTTSKLSEDGNLMGIRTLGFRGEALSSLSAISHMNMQSRTADNPGGTIISIHEGNLVDVMPIGMPVGTIVTVDNLFSSIPARKKFLKSPQTELRHITEIVLRFALSYPSIHFLLTHNNKMLFDLPRKDDRTDRIRLLLGASVFEQLIPLSNEEGYIKIDGYLGHPQIASKQNQKQYLFINGRIVSDRIISLALKESFGTLLPASHTPVFLLSLTIPYEMVDINIHPRKEQVSFTDNTMLFQTVKVAVSEALSEQNLTFRLAKYKNEHSAKTGETTSFAGKLLKGKVIQEKQDLMISKQPRLFQIDNTYIVVQSPGGVIIYDQHAAHERILFEEFMQTFVKEKKKMDFTELPTPYRFTLSKIEQQIFEEYEKIFEEYGFYFKRENNTTLILASIPTVFAGRNIGKIIRDMLDDLAGDTGLKAIDIRSQRMLVFLACRAGVKAGDNLTETEMKEIVTDLNSTENNSTCPHGRPTHFMISQKDLAVFFKRV